MRSKKQIGKNKIKTGIVFEWKVEITKQTINLNCLFY